MRTFHVVPWASFRFFAAHYKAQKGRKNTDDVIAPFQFSTRSRTCIHFPRCSNPFVLLYDDLKPTKSHTLLLKTLQ